MMVGVHTVRRSIRPSRRTSYGLERATPLFRFWRTSGRWPAESPEGPRFAGATGTETAPKVPPQPVFMG